jgi:hypothetical protein
MGRRIGHKSRSNGRTYIGSSPSPTKIVDTPASITDPRHKPSLIPIKNANRIITLFLLVSFVGRESWEKGLTEYIDLRNCMLGR